MNDQSSTGLPHAHGAAYARRKLTCSPAKPWGIHQSLLGDCPRCGWAPDWFPASPLAGLSSLPAAE
jgi:hypothetical protein